jgi:hypothetical protein
LLFHVNPQIFFLFLNLLLQLVVFRLFNWLLLLLLLLLPLRRSFF